MAVITCMDGRIDPIRILAMGLGDIHVIRNAGGLVTEDVLRSLVVSQRMLGTRDVLIFMHTDCGLYRLDDKAERAAAEAEMKERIPFEFGGFTDLEGRTRASVLAAQNCRYLPHRDRISGGVYDVQSSVLHRLH